MRPIDVAYRLLKDDDDDEVPEFPGLESLFSGNEEIWAKRKAEREQREREEMEAEQRMKDMDEGNARRPYAMHDSEALQDMLDEAGQGIGIINLMDDPKIRQLVIDELNLRGDYSHRDIARNVRDTVSENFFADRKVPEGFNNMDADERQSWQQKNASEPFEIAYRLLKMPIVPDSIKTKDEDGVMSLQGEFLDDSNEDSNKWERMPIFADWTKPVTLPNDGTEPLDYATLGDIDIGIGSPGEEHKRTDSTERRGKFQLAQLPTGSYIPGPSTHDVAIEVPPEHRQKGYSKAMIEMLGNLLQHKDARGQIGINPFQDGFTGLGYDMMRGVLQKQQMAQMLRQHFISQIPTNPMMIDNLNAMNHMISGSRNDFSRAVDQDSLRDDEDSIEREIYRTREGRGDGEVA